MARTMSAGNGKANGEDGPTKGHNVKQITGSIRSAFNQLYLTEKAIAEADEKHLQPLKRDRTKRWRNLKAETNIDRQVLELDYKKYKLARQASEDKENGGEVLDAMAIAHEAMHPGEIVDWEKIVRDLDAPREKLVEDDERDWSTMPEFNAGKTVAKAGGDRDDHDYQDGTDEAKAWQAGWDEGKTERAAATKKPKPRKGKTSERATA